MVKNNIKFAFFGTPEIASKTLEILKQNGFIPSLIITATDKPQGRKMIVTPPPVKTWAKQNNIPVLQPEKLDKNFTLQLSTFNFQLSIVVAYGKIFPEWIINMPKLGTFNIHYSLLPKYRGASPVQAAILNGETETGVTIQKMVKGLDAGPIIAQEKTAIKPDDKTPELLSKLVNLGGILLSRTLPDYISGKISPKIQDNARTSFCGKIKKEDGLINLADDPIENYNKFRAYFEWPRTFFMRDGKRVIITDAIMENGKFLIKKILPEGKNETDYLL
jgi:methionyl-tRNA formyltransferase